MQEVNPQMVLKLHQMSGEPVANCHYLLTQTNGDYELALKILQRILEQRKAEAQSVADGQGSQDPQEEQAPQTPLQALEERVYQLEVRFATLADMLETVSGKLSLMLEKIAGPDEQG